jgi:hypothetical protein
MKLDIKWQIIKFMFILTPDSVQFQETSNVLVTIDVAANTTRARSVYECSNVVDVALFTDPEEIYLVNSGRIRCGVGR